MLHPVIPGFTDTALKFLNEEEISWDSIDTPLLGCEVNAFEPIVIRIDDKQISQLLGEENG